MPCVGKICFDADVLQPWSIDDLHESIGLSQFLSGSHVDSSSCRLYGLNTYCNNNIFIIIIIIVIVFVSVVVIVFVVVFVLVVVVLIAVISLY